MQILCTVDIRTRELYLEDVTIAAFDHLVDDVLFVIEPIDGFQLETSTIKIAAVGPLGEPHDYEIDPSTVTVDEETGNINFIWSIPVGVTAMPLTTFKISDTKKITFAVCAEIVSGDNLVKAWHSDDGTIKVKAHLEPESGGGEDPSEEATNAQKIAQLQTNVAVINTQVVALGNGSPTPVATVAEMTDESAVYLYTGSETGYTAGNWYYYNGTSWTSGGVYGGATTSTTFNQHGVPADDFAVGEALAEKADADDVTAIDERVTALEAGGGGGNPFDIPTATNLITILRKCVFSEDVSINIENLAEALGVNSGGDDDDDDDDMTFRYGQSIPKGNTSRALELTGMTIALTEIRLVVALHSDFAAGGFCWVQAPNAGTPYVGVDANGDFDWSNSSTYSGSFSATPSNLSDFVNTIKEVKIKWLNPTGFESRKYLSGFKFFFNNYNPSCGYTLYRCSGFNGSTEVFRLESSGKNGELYDVLTGTTYTFNNTTAMEIVEVSE